MQLSIFTSQALAAWVKAGILYFKYIGLYYKSAITWISGYCNWTYTDQ